MKIDRCICFNKTFDLLKDIAITKRCVTIDALQKHVAFGQKCKLCKPYVCEMLKSGQTEFFSLIEEVRVELD